MTPAPRSTKRERTDRLLLGAEAAGEYKPDAPIAYLHSVLTQTVLPYRNPGDEVREWERRNGLVRLEVSAGKAVDPHDGEWKAVGLPYGPKARLILAHLNAEAIVAKSPVVDVGHTIRGFVRRLHLDDGGRNIATIRNQLTRLAASTFRLGMAQDGRSVTVNATVVSQFELSWDEQAGRSVWPTTIRLSTDYFESLREHAVPLSESALAALSGNAMGLDVYAWLAQRLHRIPAERPQFLRWTTLHEQFGEGYERCRDFRRAFLKTLSLVQTQYPAARISERIAKDRMGSPWSVRPLLERDPELTPRGLVLKNSPPPVPAHTSVTVLLPVGKPG